MGRFQENRHTEPTTLATIDCVSKPGRKRVTVLCAETPATRARERAAGTSMMFNERQPVG